ncbi:MAG: hypothetical protein ISR85_03545 [Kiritimatiellales bacterium]|nr:hypothetical protein [Kiritimatiellota bacterium]MBL7011986.1 hypothetical protein [Kiritimatiellales bacterium]
MRKIFWILMGLLLTGCLQSSQGTQEQTLTIVNATVVDATVLEQARAFAQQELRVPVRVIDNPQLAGLGDFQTLENAAVQAKQENDVAYIVVAELDGEEHLTVNADSGIAIINAKALYTDDTEVFTGRIRRMVMRAAAFSLGLPPTPDPFCVTRDYRSLQDLDRMGNNYSPPWQARFAEEAAKRGLQPPNPADPQRLAAP